MYGAEISDSLALKVIQGTALIAAIFLCSLTAIHGAYNYFTQEIPAHLRNILFSSILAVSITLTSAYCSQTIGNITSVDPSTFRYSTAIASIPLSLLAFATASLFLLLLFSIIQFFFAAKDTLLSQQTWYAKLIRCLFVGISRTTEQKARTKLILTLPISIWAAFAVTGYAVTAFDVVRILHFENAVRFIIFEYEMYENTHCEKAVGSRVAYLSDKLILIGTPTTEGITFKTGPCQKKDPPAHPTG